MPEPTPHEATDPPVDGRRRLLAALTGRPGRGAFVVAVLLALVGFAAAVQVRSNDSEGEFAGARRADLVTLLDSLGSARDRAENQINELEETKRDLQSSNNQARTALEEARKEATTLAILTGTVAATGPGVVVTIDDPKGAVGASVLLNAVEELRDSGAEAIQVNNVARVVAQTYFADGDGYVLVDGVELRPPFTLTVIGSPQDLATAVTFRGGLADTVEQLGGDVTVTTEDVVNVTALAEGRDPEYAQPAP
jgi:uncharacterized protein YlxW (UPF0749 family)